MTNELKQDWDHEEKLEKKEILPEVALKSAYDNLSFKETIFTFKKAVTVCTLLCVAAAADGYQINLNGNIIAHKGFIRQIGVKGKDGTYALTTTYTSLWGAMQSLGQLIGMVGLSPVSDRIGRKYTLYILWCVLLGSMFIETFVQNWKDWAGAKLLAGVGVGAIQSTLPIYITEWCPSTIRGTVLSAYSVWNQLGNFIAPVILLGLKDDSKWRTAIYTQWAFLGLMLPVFLYLPETPSFFAARGQDEQGLKSLINMNGGIKGYDAQHEYAVIKNIIEEERRVRESYGQAVGWREIVRSYGECFDRVNWRRTVASSLPLMAQQLTGLAFLSTYASLFLQQAGFESFQITSILFGVKVGVIIIVVMVNDKFGRRNITIGAIGLCVAMLLLVGILGQFGKTTPLKNTLIAAACLWSAGSATLSGTGYVYVGEVASQRLRARTAGLATAMAVIFGLTFNTAVPTMLQKNGANWGYNTAWLFFGLGIIALALAIWLLPEPAQRNAAELDEMYEKGIKPWRMRKYVCEVSAVNPPLEPGRP